ncbi:MAG: hypothetical protein R2712_03270 [Vicinamibacterales bacterium]
MALLDGPAATDAHPDSRHAGAFAQALADVLHEMGALVATGGETAAALLARCGHGLQIVGEIEPGIALASRAASSPCRSSPSRARSATRKASSGA